MEKKENPATYFIAPAGEGKTYIYMIVCLFYLHYKLAAKSRVLFIVHNVTC